MPFGKLLISCTLAARYPAAGLQGAAQAPHGTIVPGDILLGVGGRAVRSAAELDSALDRCKPRDTVSPDPATSGHDPRGENRAGVTGTRGFGLLVDFFWLEAGKTIGGVMERRTQG